MLHLRISSVEDNTKKSKLSSRKSRRSKRSSGSRRSSALPGAVIVKAQVVLEPSKAFDLDPILDNSFVSLAFDDPAAKSSSSKSKKAKSKQTETAPCTDGLATWPPAKSPVSLTFHVQYLPRTQQLHSRVSGVKLLCNTHKKAKSGVSSVVSKCEFDLARLAIDGFGDNFSLVFSNPTDARGPTAEVQLFASGRWLKYDGKRVASELDVLHMSSMPDEQQPQHETISVNGREITLLPAEPSQPRHRGAKSANAAGASSTDVSDFEDSASEFESDTLGETEDESETDLETETETDNETDFDTDDSDLRSLDGRRVRRGGGGFDDDDDTDDAAAAASFAAIAARAPPVPVRPHDTPPAVPDRQPAESPPASSHKRHSSRASGSHHQMADSSSPSDPRRLKHRDSAASESPRHSRKRDSATRGSSSTKLVALDDAAADLVPAERAPPPPPPPSSHDKHHHSKASKSSKGLAAQQQQQQQHDANDAAATGRELNVSLGTGAITGGQGGGAHSQDMYLGSAFGWLPQDVVREFVRHRPEATSREAVANPIDSLARCVCWLLMLAEINPRRNADTGTNTDAGTDGARHRRRGGCEREALGKLAHCHTQVVAACNRLCVGQRRRQVRWPSLGRQQCCAFDDCCHTKQLA